MNIRHSGGVNFALGLPSSKLPTFSAGAYALTNQIPPPSRGRLGGGWG